MAVLSRRMLIKSSVLAISASVLGNAGRAAGITVLKIANADAPVVINAGVSGNNTVDLLARLNTDCLAHKPELTVLMVGTNDMNSQKYVPLNRYVSNLELIISKIKETGSRVLLLTILPFYEPYLLSRHPATFYNPEGVAIRRNLLNEAIIATAKRQQVDLLDIGDRFEVLGKVGLAKDSLFQNEANTGKTDGVHPTSTGYRFLALAVYDYIANNQLPAGKIVCLGDSITYGYGATRDESYPAYLLNLLSSRKSNGMK